MGMWNWLFGEDMTPATMDINPATGLPMIGGIGGVDAGGSPYGMDWQKNDFSSAPSHFNSESDMGVGFGNEWPD